MQPAQLTAQSFASYPPQARVLAVQNLALIQQLPLILAALLLREMGSYDWRFPAERRTIDDQFLFLQSLPSSDRDQLLRGFGMLSLSPDLASLDWIKSPQPFIDGLTAHLWATHQHDAFRTAAEQYGEAWHKALPDPMPAMPRLGIVVLGKEVRSADWPLYRKLRPHGVYFSQVDPAGAWQAIRETVAARAAKSPTPYRHWYIDGDMIDPFADASIASIGYGDLKPVRTAILHRMQSVIGSGSGGPEALRTLMAETTPADIGLPDGVKDDALSRFKISVLAEGSGTQIFSTTFVQWTAREALRRAQPCTLLLRYAPRQRQLPMNELLSGATDHNQPDPAGSLVDADMGAFYTWINQQRLTGADRSAFLVWSEEHKQAVAIGPALPKATTATNSASMKQLLSQLT
jgi:hypothetical protein